MAVNFDINHLIESITPDKWKDQESYSSMLPAYGDWESWAPYYQDELGINVSKYSGFYEFERDPGNIYNQFTNYVMDNLDNEDVKRYINALYQNTKGTWKKKGATDPDKWTLFGHEDDNGQYMITDPEEFKKAYQNAREDQQGGNFHLSAPIKLSSETTQQTILESESGSGTESGAKLKSEDPKDQGPGNPYFIIPKKEPEKTEEGFKYPPYTSGLALKNIYHNTDKAIRDAYKHLTGLQAPLKSSYNEFYPVTNNYYVRSQMQKRANELRREGSKAVYSDINKQLQWKEHHDAKADQIEQQALALKEETFNKENKKAHEVANKNISRDVQAANENHAAAVALANSIKQKKAQEVMERANNYNNYKAQQESSYRQYLRDKRVAYEQYKAEKLDVKSAELLAQAQKEYNDILNEDIGTNENYSNQIKNIELLKRGDSWTPQESSEWLKCDTLEKKIEFAKKHSDKEPFKSIFAAHQKDKATRARARNQQFTDDLAALKKSLQAGNYILSGEGFDDIGNNQSTKEKSEDWLTNLYRFKSGGELKLKQDKLKQKTVSDFTKVHRQLLKDAQQKDLRREEIAKRSLDKALGRLSQEDIIFLKNLFQ